MATNGDDNSEHEPATDDVHSHVQKRLTCTGSVYSSLRSWSLMIRSIDGEKKKTQQHHYQKTHQTNRILDFFFHIPVFLNLLQASMYSCCHDLLIPDSDSVRLPFAALQPKCDQIVGRYAQTISFLLTPWFSALTRGTNS